MQWVIYDQLRARIDEQPLILSLPSILPISSNFTIFPMENLQLATLPTHPEEPKHLCNHLRRVSAPNRRW
jgi:hypothetical protein